MEKENRSLPFGETIVKSLSYGVNNIAYFFSLSLTLWGVLLLTIIAYFVTEVVESVTLTIVGALFVFVGVIAVFLVFIMIATAPYRRILQNEKGINLTLKGREFDFFMLRIGYGFMFIIPIFIVLTLTFALESVGLDFVGIAISVVVFVYLLLYFSRIIIVFPSVAISAKNLTISEAAALTKGNGWKLFLGLLILFLPLYLASSYTLIAIEAYDESSLDIVLLLIYALLGVLQTAFVTSFIAFAYKFFTDEQMTEEVKEVVANEPAF